LNIFKALERRRYLFYDHKIIIKGVSTRGIAEDL